MYLQLSPSSSTANLLRINNGQLRDLLYKNICKHWHVLMDSPEPDSLEEKIRCGELHLLDNPERLYYALDLFFEF